MPVRKSPEETAKRREEVKGFMETIGPYSVPKETLAEKHNVTIKVIYNDIKFWLKKLDFKKMDFEGRRILMGIQKNMALVEAMKVDGSLADKLKAIKLANDTAEAYTRLLEQFGFKEKVAEHLHVTENVNKLSKEEIEAEVKRLLGK